jgi:hypothetical protein
MRRCYEIVNTEGQQQAILNALPAFGIPAAFALKTYIEIRKAFLVLGIADGLVPADTIKFNANTDGSVTYTPPTPPVLNPKTP